MNDLANDWLKYLILLLAVGVGYVLISKLLDFMIPSKKPKPKPSEKPLATEVADVDTLRKRQDEAYKSWEKTRRK